jgi:hypothetical protein
VSASGIEHEGRGRHPQIHSGRNALRYLGEAPATLASADGYVDTGDLVELHEGRYYFRGRKAASSTSADSKCIRRRSNRY